MKKVYFILVLLCSVVLSFAQQEYHVFPENHQETPGLPTGNGSLQSPWDLQTALNQPNKIVNAGDTIWIHEGIYNGRYSSSLNCTDTNKYITVSGYQNDRVILNGNVNSLDGQTLNVKGGRVIYKNFEVTWLGEFVRDKRDKNFVKTVSGINHYSGENCKFINIKIYNNPGLAFGSWNSTGGTLVTDCIIFNNGVINEKGQGKGVGFYVQNKSNEERIIKNNIIFNNYYKGIEVWSASKNAKSANIMNITLDNNVVFNSGLASGTKKVDNIIIGTDDRNGINIAKNITVKNNILYHNTDYKNNQVNGDAASLTIGYYLKAPVENVVVNNNIILGRNNALRLLYAKSLTFTNNKVYSGYALFNSSVFKYAKSDLWKVKNNKYYTKKAGAFRVSDGKTYAIEAWKSMFQFEENSQRQHVGAFDLENVLNITKSEYVPNQFRVVLFNKNEQDVTIDFSSYNIKEGSTYTIRDVENLNHILKTGTLVDFKTTVPMKAIHPSKTKTLDNFGVFIIDFNLEENTVETGNQNEDEESNLFERFWRFLGF